MQTIEGVNGHDLRQVTGWDYGFGGGFSYGPCPGYNWLDASHLLLYPRIGQQENSFVGAREYLVSQPTVINLESGHVWLPNTSQIRDGWICTGVYWSSDSGILITPGFKASSQGDSKEAVLTYTFNGQNSAYYWGKLVGISPSRTKIVVDDDSLVDLRTNKTTKLAWNINYDYDYAPRIYWSSDETRIYRCCYHFADTKTGESYSFDMSKLEGFGVEPPNYSHTHANGQWVRNDDYFLIGWSVVDNGYPDFFPMFDPVAKKYYEVSERVGVPADWTCVDTSVSPDEIYVWLECWEGSYLINLETFDSTAYPNYYIEDIAWSSEGKYAWVKVFNTDAWAILSISSKELTPLALHSKFESPLWWHPVENVVAYISEDLQNLELVDAQTMTNQKLALPTTFQELVWSPVGDRIALVAEDGSLWKVDYPKLENLEQLTEPSPDVRDVFWSSDGIQIAFISRSDIYIVETIK